MNAIRITVVLATVAAIFAGQPAWSEETKPVVKQDVYVNHAKTSVKQQAAILAFVRG